jgi:tetratricopeptide (TPR) repeat protein
MLYERPADALGEYEKSLQAFPQRFNSHYGAGRAAERTGKTDVAKKHYQQILAMAGRGDGKRDELANARAFLAR